MTSHKTIFEANFPRTAYVRGEMMEIEARITNDTDSGGIVHLKFALYKKVEYDSGTDLTPKKVETEIRGVKAEEAFRVGTQKLLIQLPIPSAMLPDTHKLSKVVKVTHLVKLMAKVIKSLFLLQFTLKMLLF